MPSPAMAVNQDELLIKLGMKRKKKWSLGGQTKRTNWKSVPAAKLTKDAFWTKVDEERLASESLMEKLVDKFGTKPVPKAMGDMNGDANGGGGGKKKGKELRVL